MDLFGLLGGDALGFLSHFGKVVALWTIPFLFMLTVIVFIHELGHFLVARLCGVKVEVFSVGFGREIFGFNDRHGTRWRVSILPLGGYVKFLGDDDPTSTTTVEGLERLSPELRGRSFASKSVGQRAAIVAAGPMANFVLAIGIFAAIFATLGRPIMVPRVDAIETASPAERAGFKVGDVVEAINGSAISSFADLQRFVAGEAGKDLSFSVRRGAEKVTLLATPERREVTDQFGNVHRTARLGIQHRGGQAEATIQHFSVPAAIWEGVKETWFIIDQTFSSLGRIATFQESADQLGGPVKIAQISSQVATLGLLAVINLTAILSVSIGLLNLFPVPILDGGHLLFYAIEAIRGRPLSGRLQEIGFRIGLAAVIMLMIFVTVNDTGVNKWVAWLWG